MSMVMSQEAVVASWVHTHVVQPHYCSISGAEGGAPHKADYTKPKIKYTDDGEYLF
jgi:hypothetical protein